MSKRRLADVKPVRLGAKKSVFLPYQTQYEVRLRFHSRPPSDVQIATKRELRFLKLEAANRFLAIEWFQYQLQRLGSNRK